ncbi:unnamed protein product [Sphagnum compactum]
MMVWSLVQCGSCRNFCSIPPSMRLLCSSSQQQQYCGGHGGLVSSLQLPDRSQTNVERTQLLVRRRKSENSILQQSPVVSRRKRASRFRLSAVAELRSTSAMVVVKEVEELGNSAASSVGGAIQALKTGPAQLLDPSLSSSSSSASISLPGATVVTAAGDSADHGRLAPDSPVIDSLREQLSNITDSLTGAGKAAGNILEETKASISDTVMAVQDSVTRGFTNVQEITRDSGDSVTRSFKNVQEITRDLGDSNVGGNGVKDVNEGFAGAGKAAANMLEEAKASIMDTVMAVQDSVTRSFRNVPEITGDSGNSTVGNNGVKDVYGGFAGAGEAAANILEDTKASITNTVMAVQDTVTRSFTNVQDITTDSGDSVGNSVKDVYRGFAGAGKVAANILEETKASITDTVTAAQDSATRSFTNVQEITRDLRISVGNGVKDVYKDFAGAGKAAVNTLEETNASITDTATAVQDSVTRSFTNVQEITRDSVDSVGSAVKDVYEGFNGSVMDSIDRVTGFYDKTVGDVQSTLDNTVTKAEGSVTDFTGTFQMGTTVNDALRDAVITVHSATGSALKASASAVADFYGSTKILLPTEAQLVLSIVEQIHDLSAPVGNALQQVYVGIENVERAAGVNPENPLTPVLLVVGGTLCIGLSYWQVRYGGYSGDLIPTSALDLLKKDGNAVLVDLRSQVEREKDGVPDLRRGARSRSATVEAFKVEGSLRNKLNNPKEIDTIITAAIICNLKGLKPSSKVIVMDEDGSHSKAVARALHRFGIKRRYRMDGGFRAWNASGLRTKPEGTETAITVLKEDTEDFIEEVKPTAEEVFLVCMGIVAGLYAAIEWEKTLQLIGVIGISQVVYSKAKAYDSFEDVKADFRVLQKSLSLAMQGLLRISGQAESGTLQLVTSPNTSAVQERVVRAAAKHGPLASEDESKLELESEHMSEVESLPFLFTEDLNAMPTRPEELSPPSLRE